MTRTAALTWSVLNILNKRRYDAIVEVFGGLEAALPMVSESFLKELGLKDDSIRRVLLTLESFDAEACERELTRRGITFLSIEDDAYPSSLRQIPDPPLFLYVRGDLSILAQPCVALVGTREMSSYGRRVTEHFVYPIVRAGCITVSGLASGIDTVVARETLHAGGRTVAALGHGLRMIFPSSNEKLAEQIVERGGLLISEFPLDTEPQKMTFPARNRIIAGLSLATVVLEAPAESGALITAELALEYGRDVFAVPGSIFDANYAGCHRLIASGQAKLVTSPGEVLADLGIKAPVAGTRAAYEPKTPDEAVVYGALTTLPQTVDELVEKTKVPAPRVSVALTMLELAGAVEKVGSGQWVRR